MASDGEYGSNLFGMSDGFSSGQAGGSADPCERKTWRTVPDSAYSLPTVVCGVPGNLAMFQDSLSSVDDLRLQWVGLLHSMNPTPCMQSYWEKGQVQHKVFFGSALYQQLWLVWRPSHLVYLMRAHIREVFFNMQSKCPILDPIHFLLNPCTEQSGHLCQWGLICHSELSG